MINSNGNIENKNFNKEIENVKSDLDGMKLISNEEEKSELRERVFINFMFDISEFLNKKEKNMIREVSQSFNRYAFSEFQINLILKRKSETEEFNSENMDLKKIVQYYKNIEKLTIESIRLDDNILDALEIIANNNQTKIKKLIINNVEYSKNENIARLLVIINQLLFVNELTIGNIGNRDKLLLHLQVNNKYLKIADKIKILKIDNIQTNQIPFILSVFPNVVDLTIENCSLDEELEIVYNVMKDSMKEDSLLHINLSSNGLSSPEAMDSLKKITKRQTKLQCLVLKGLWFNNLSYLIEEFKVFNNLIELDLQGSKFIFNNVGSLLIFNEIKHIKKLNLSDCGMEDEDFEKLCFNFNESVSGSLEELILIRNLITNESIDSFIKYKSKFISMKTLNLSFNQKINSKGFNNLLGFLYSLENKENGVNNLKHLDLRNTGVSLKNSTTNLIDFVFNKSDNFEILDLYFCSFNGIDYVNFIKTFYLKSQQYTHKDYRCRIYLKLNRELNKKLFESVAHYTDELYKKYNILIR